jgi:hypothetical protein
MLTWLCLALAGAWVAFVAIKISNRTVPFTLVVIKSVNDALLHDRDDGLTR